MRRYWIPVLLYLLGVALCGAWAAGDGSRWMGIVALATYGVASLWLSWAALVAPTRQWSSYLVVWLPAILPLWLINVALRAMEQTDAAAMAVLLYAPVIVAFLLLPLISTGLLLARREQPRG